jgi:Glycosyl transferases group 1
MHKENAVRILLVANGNIKHRGASYYDHAMKLRNGFIRNGHDVFFMSDRDIARSATALGVKALGEQFCNTYFLDVCKNYQPELIVLCHADIIRADSIAQVRARTGVKIAQFNVDPVFRVHNMAMIRAKLGVVDATFVTTAGPVLKRFSNPAGFVAFLPNPVDPSIDWPKAHESSDQPHDVFWALRPSKHTSPSQPRIGWPLFVEASGKIDIRYHGMNGVPPLINARYYNQIARCRMGLNISVAGELGRKDHADREELYLYSSDRIAQYMGSGLLVFTTRDNSLEEMFVEDGEAIFFNGPEELLDKLVYYKANDSQRRAIAAAGHTKAHTHLNERLVARHLIEATLDQPVSPVIWPVERY